MSNYGLNFGFRRSGEDASTREGRFRVPRTGDFRQGQLVTIDPAAPGFIKLADAGATIVPGVTGLLIQHQGWDQSQYDAPLVDSHQLGKVLNGVLCTIWSGLGIKIWLKNTPGENRFDGRVIEPVEVLTGAAGLSIGDDLGWNGTTYAAGGTPVARVVASNERDYVEATLIA